MKLIKFHMPVLLLILSLLVGCTSSGVGPERASRKESYSASLARANPVVTRHFANGLKAMHAGDLGNAHKIMYGLSKEYPSLSGPHANLGIIYYEQGKPAKAEAAFKEALRLNHKRPEVHNRLGILYRSQGRFRDARISYQLALKQDKNYANAQLNLGILHDLYLNNAPKALFHYEQFQAMQKKKDRAVTKWILDIRRRVKPATRSARVSK